MSDTDTILQALKEHREETRQDMHELRQAVVKIADAAADMGKTMARSEERHSTHEDAVKRMGRTLDDHEGRIRVIESDHPSSYHSQQINEIKAQLLTGKSSVTASWKTLAVIGTLMLGAAALASAFVKVTS